jgi:diguanylate cyclase (GGDEF)-like protein
MASFEAIARSGDPVGAPEGGPPRGEVPDGQGTANTVAAGARVVSLHRATQAALIDSRQRWRDLVEIAADLAFETGPDGRLTFLVPDAVLGWPSAALIGHRPVEAGLLLRPEPDPFCLRAAARDVRALVRRSDGQAAVMSFSVAPLRGIAGAFRGLRGCARDITQEVAEAEAQAAELRRALALQGLVRHVREAVLAPRMLPALLALLPTAIGCAGAMLVELGAEGEPSLRHAAVPDQTGARPPPLLAEPGIASGLGADPTRSCQPIFTRGMSGEPVAIVPQPVIVPFAALHAASTSSGATGRSRPQRQGLLVWREAGARPFDEDERHLLEALSDLLGVVLGNQRLLTELERQARTEEMTGLMNRRAFLEELRRRMDRLSREGRGGSLLFIDVDNLKPVNDRLGHEAGDALLVAVAELIRAIARPTDLAARLGGDEFALWLDGVLEEPVAAARACALCAGARGIVVAGDPDRQLPVTLSVGVALSRGEDGAAAPAVLARADGALYAAKRAGRDTWRLASLPQAVR